LPHNHCDIQSVQNVADIPDETQVKRAAENADPCVGISGTAQFALSGVGAMAARSALQETGEALRFFPVSIASLDNDTLAMDLYLKPTGRSEPVLYRSSGVEFSAKDQQRLIAQGVEFLYIPTHQHGVYRRAFTQRLDRLYRDPQTNRAERMRVVRASCTKIIEDVLVFPGQTETIDAVSDISKQFAAWSAEERQEPAHEDDDPAHG